MALTRAVPGSDSSAASLPNNSIMAGAWSNAVWRIANSRGCTLEDSCGLTLLAFAFITTRLYLRAARIQLDDRNMLGATLGATYCMPH